MKTILFLDEPYFCKPFVDALREEGFQVIIEDPCYQKRMSRTAKALRKEYDLVIVEPVVFDDSELEDLQALLSGFKVMAVTTATRRLLKTESWVLKPVSIYELVSKVKKLTR
jgi:hypothetical protein